MKELLKEGKDKELDWDVEKVCETFPEITYARDDDDEQRFLNSALTPYIVKHFEERIDGLENEIRRKETVPYNKHSLIINIIGWVILWVLIWATK